MYIFRWLMKHPVIILALYFLSIVAILFSMTGGGSSDKSTDIAESAEVQKADSTEVDTSKAAAIEPSTLTSALVDGEAVKTDAESTEVGSEESTKKTDTADGIKDAVITSEEAVVKSETEEVVKTESSKVADAEAEEVKEATETVAVTEEQSSEDAVVEEVVKTEEVPAAEGISEETTEVTTTDASTDAENKTTETNDSQFSEMNTDELLLMAREAYWNNGLEESAEIYQQLITASPDVVDYKGELGNVYWRLGLPEKAAELYAEISMPMIEAGSADKVANMVGFIGLFYPEKATEIHNKLQAEK